MKLSVAGLRRDVARLKARAGGAAIGTLIDFLEAVREADAGRRDPRSIRLDPSFERTLGQVVANLAAYQELTADERELAMLRTFYGGGDDRAGTTPRHPRRTDPTDRPAGDPDRVPVDRPARPDRSAGSPDQ